MKLLDVAEISYGFSFREKIIPQSEGNVYVIQPKNITNTGEVLLSEAERVNVDNLKDRLILRNDDVLLINRGRFIAGIFSNVVSKQFIASSALFVLRVKQTIVSPSFIVSFLNSQMGQKSMDMISESMTIPSLSKDAVGNIDIPQISMSKQMSVVRMDQDFKYYQELISKKVSLEGMLISHKMNNLLSVKER